ncbi:geranylgeranylglyceryl/heptaprenylglyceryl phosphate synthase [Algoriphagus sp. PAP.12]|uniref:geranylgeranylglyceryl/heptaprenylglyceryl phosphate synthase n=1 Tax=Algoriphagus sp. PAP.12 TaxID=2996678 RepID=UPI00227CE597|nr:geranylgeranylglyceryl/heptaprenylglyceryl phosphate synthase [Algoriphagus sp. PAP.12]
MKSKKKVIAKSLKAFSKKNKKGIAWLIDPDKFSLSKEFDWNWIQNTSLDFIFVGGSHFDQNNFEEIISYVKKFAKNIPVVIFPGSKLQVSAQADGILFLSLISGRNPDYLISQQVKAAKQVHHSNLEVLPTAYLLVNDGEIKSVHRESNTLPIPNSNREEIISTALAGKFLGMNYCFLDAGSGARNSVSPEVITSIKECLDCPLIVGGGIDSLQKINQAFESGADLVVIGNQIEKDPDFLSEVLSFKDWYNQSLHVN